MDNHLEHLRICHVNCQSLFAYLDEFRLFFSNKDFHIICISETWLKPEISDNFIGLSDYSLHRRDRCGRAGGGVGFFLLDSLSADILEDSGDDNHRRPEFLLAEINFKNAQKLLLAVVYRSHHVGFIVEFEERFFTL